MHTLQEIKETHILCQTQAEQRRAHQSLQTVPTQALSAEALCEAGTPALVEIQTRHRSHRSAAQEADEHLRDLSGRRSQAVRGSGDEDAPTARPAMPLMPEGGQDTNRRPHAQANDAIFTRCQNEGDSMILIPYKQGRYLCLCCGDFNVILPLERSMKQRVKCPRCLRYSSLKDQCNGRSVAPQFGATKPKPEFSNMPGSWYDRNGEPKAKTSNRNNAGRRRQRDHCDECQTIIFDGVSGARYYADTMAIQHGKAYKPYVCPHGNGIHVQQI